MARSKSSKQETLIPANSTPAKGFAELVEPYRRVIKAHCYRMTGSLHESEDLLQETLLRAWRSFDDLETKNAVKAWLFQIAKRVCLDTLAKRKRQRRILPETTFPPATELPSGTPPSELTWVEPYPDSETNTTADENPNPEVRYQRREAVRLAFVAALQHLPPRQRAVLLLIDVLGWSSAEVTALIGGSHASTNSVLQRARTTLALHYHAVGHVDTVRDAAENSLLEHYVEAWESKNLDGFVALLKKEATFAMPPWRQWYFGRDSIQHFFAQVWKHYDGFYLRPTSANASPAFGLYSRNRSNDQWSAHSLQVLCIEDGKIKGLTAFLKPLSPLLFPAFGLALEIPLGRNN